MKRKSIFSELTPEQQEIVRAGLRKYGRVLFGYENNAGVIFSILRGETPCEFGGKPPIAHHAPIPEWQTGILLPF